MNEVCFTATEPTNDDYIVIAEGFGTVHRGITITKWSNILWDDENPAYDYYRELMAL